MPIEDDRVLLADHAHFAEGFFKNEEIGEKRVEFFITIATAVLGGVFALIASTSDPARKEEIGQVAVFALLGILVLGLLTFVRILQRDRVTDEYKNILKFLRRELSRRSVSLEGYAIPFGAPLPAVARAGLALTVGVMNSLIAACATAVSVAPAQRWALGSCAFLAFFSVQAAVISRRRKAKSGPEELFRAGAGAVIKNAQGEVLALRRKGLTEAWQLPQGGLEAGESPVEAAYREIREETGIEKGHLRQIGQEGPLLAYELPREYWSRKTGRGQVHRWFLFRFEGPNSAITLGDKKEFDDWRWMPLADLAGRTVMFRKPVYEQLEKVWGEDLKADYAKWNTSGNTTTTRRAQIE